ncbi:hypothetical protein DRI50_03435 [candidate division KSB1 bacterium]|nr:MAG: hypothetical protein DRI50_03435 [candidate division KSB1 bacterium]
MKYEIIKRNVVPDAETEKIIARKIEKIEKLLESFNEDLFFLRINFNEIKKRKRFNVRLMMQILGRHLRVKKEGPDLPAVTIEAFEALIREIKKFKEFLRNEPEFRRKIRPSYKEKINKAQLKQEVQEAFEKYVEEIMPRLYSFALKEVRNRIYQGQLRQGDIQVKDVLDEAIVRVSDMIKNETEFKEKEVKKELYRHIIRIINKWTKERRSQLSILDKTIPPEEIDNELYEFYQPDDILHVEDVIPDTVETPEDEVEEEELQKSIDQVISMMPDKWRQAFRLIELEGFSPDEVAMIQDRSVEEVKKEVEMARAFIAEKMEDLGLEWLER